MACGHNVPPVSVDNKAWSRLPKLNVRYQQLNRKTTPLLEGAELAGFRQRWFGWQRQQPLNGGRSPGEQ